MREEDLRKERDDFQRKLSLLKAQVAAEGTSQGARAISDAMRNLGMQAILVNMSSDLQMAESYAEGVEKTNRNIEIKAEAERREAEAAANSAAAFTPKYPPAPGFQTEIFNRMNAAEQKLFASIDPNAPVKLLKLDENGMPVMVGGKMQYVTTADGSLPKGAVVRDALIDIKQYTPDGRKGMPPLEPGADYERRMEVLGGSLGTVQGFRAKQIVDEKGGPDNDDARRELTDLQRQVDQAKGKIRDSVEASKRAKDAMRKLEDARRRAEAADAADTPEPDRAKAKAAFVGAKQASDKAKEDFQKSQDKLGGALQGGLDQLTGNKEGIEQTKERGTMGSALGSEKQLLTPPVMSPDGSMIPTKKSAGEVLTPKLNK